MKLNIAAAILLPIVIVTSSLPHIVHIVIDDFGWDQVGYHSNSDEVITPNIDKLVREGVDLDRHYVHKICSPSRVALQSGRSPIHSNVQNVHPEVHNGKDELSGFQGLPLNMSTIADVLKTTHSTHFVGKWDVGMASHSHMPFVRGYETFTGYFHHSNDYWQQTEQKCYNKPVFDLWKHNSTFSGPAVEHKNGPTCTQDKQKPVDGGKCVYEEEILLGEVLKIIDAHQPAAKPAKPMFLFYSTHLTHMPLQLPEEDLEKFANIKNEYRRSMRAMSHYVDKEVGQVVEKLKESGMWDKTLLVLHSDNGGEIMTQFCGSSNHPLRGGKFSNYEGGIRVNALVSGGFLPRERRGTKLESLFGGEDWLKTYSAIAGVESDWESDVVAVNSGLPDFDGVNQWPVILGELEFAREEIAIGDTSAIEFNGDGDALVGGILRKDGYKILLGAKNKKFKICQDVLTGENYPDGGVVHRIPELVCRICSREPESGCLFNVLRDETESNNLASSQVELFAELLNRVDELQKSIFSPNRGSKDTRACRVAEEKYGGYWGPFL